MQTFKTWPHLTLIAIAFALLGGIGAALWVRHEQNTSAHALPNAARLERIEGQVGINNTLENSSNQEWLEATQNMPVSVGDRIYTRDNSQVAIAFTGRNFARVNDRSALDILELNERRTQLALREGSALFDVGYLSPGDLFEVATPYGAVDFNQPGLYEVGLNDNGGAVISVLSGLAQVVGLAGSGQISRGEVLTLIGQTAANIALSRLDRGYAGGLVDDYYSYRYPQVYDGRYSNYDAYLNDPYYYDPYRQYSSYQYATDVIPGLYDLDYYGDWQNVNGYGECWRPRVDAGWQPYQSGYWQNDYPYGPTWVSAEPWGYAPYHYGRWAYVNNQWFWVPDRVNSDPIYSPALVAFVPLNQTDQVGWIPLGPGDPYAPRYYDADWQPHYLTRTALRQSSFINLDVPGALTVVPLDQFQQVIDRRRIERLDRHRYANVQPVLDPLLLTPLRNAAVRSAWGRGKIAVPPGIAKKLDETRVVTSVEPNAPPFRKDLARSLRVEAIPARVKNEKLRWKDERHEKRDERQAANLERQRFEVEQRDKARRQRDERQQARQFEFEQRKQQQEQVQAQREAQRAKGERVGQQQRAQQEAVKEQQKLQREAAQRAIRAEHERRGKEQRTPQPRGQGRKQVEFIGPPVREQSNRQQAPPRAAQEVQMKQQRQAERQGRERAQVQVQQKSESHGQSRGQEKPGKGKGKP